MRLSLPLAFFLLVSCSVSVPPSPGTLKIGMGAEPDVLNPILASDAYGGWVLGLVKDPPPPPT